MKTVVVGMSGGVDSSVTALLLKNQGYRVIGVFMRNWHEEDGPCPAEEDYQDVVTVCEKLDIPHYSVDFSKAYWDLVFSRCLDDFRAGHTPNPDILCNREIKFKIFFEKAMELGADYLATGHYCRVGPSGTLLRGIDENKDQSYFLHAIGENCLERVLFPIGELPKPKVREIASDAGLITALKRDSTGICFIGKRPFRQFLSQYIEPKIGAFETPDGCVVGEHQGCAFYTFGQRKGLAIGGAGDAWYVVGKDLDRNVVVVVQGDHHPLLFRSEMLVTEVSWIGPSPCFPLKCTVKVRYRSEDVACEIEKKESGDLKVTFAHPQRAVTPRQSAVFYDGERCLGGGLIL